MYTYMYRIIYIYMYMYICNVYVHTHIYICVCIYIYVYLYMHTPMFYTCIFLEFASETAKASGEDGGQLPQRHVGQARSVGALPWLLLRSPRALGT